MLSAFVAVSTALCSLGGSSCGVCSGHMSGSYRHALWRANAPAPPHRHTAALMSSCNRRGALLLTSAALLSRGSIAPASARTPGSEDLSEAITQIRDGRTVLAKLRREWSQYAVIDAEGRAGNIDAARRVLGGVAPQRGEAAIAVAKTTPLYRIDGAFAAVRKAVLNGKAGEWGENIDVEEASLTSLTAPPMIIYGPHLPP